MCVKCMSLMLTLPWGGQCERMLRQNKATITSRHSLGHNLEPPGGPPVVQVAREDKEQVKGSNGGLVGLVKGRRVCLQSRVGRGQPAVKTEWGALSARNSTPVSSNSDFSCAIWWPRLALAHRSDRNHYHQHQQWPNNHDSEVYQTNLHTISLLHLPRLQ